MAYRWMVPAAAAAALLLGDAHGEPKSGDIFWETSTSRGKSAQGYYVEGCGLHFGEELGCFDSLLPIQGSVDLEGAVRAEVQIQKALIDGSTEVKLSVNNHDWLNFPTNTAVPNWNSYQHQWYPTIEVPLGHFSQGEGNTFRMGVQSPSSAVHVHGVTFRIYYDASKPHPTGSITSVTSGDVLGEEVVLEAADAASPNGAIKSVDYLGYYEDVNYMVAMLDVTGRTTRSR